MIKLTQIFFELSDKAIKKELAIEEVYEEACKEAEMLGRAKPPAPAPTKPSDAEYTIIQAPLFIDPKLIMSISTNPTLDTQLTCSNLVSYLVKESPGVVYKRIQSHDKRKI
jgi:uncharacterized protein YlzI (FlbEa/FlbD family)